VGTFGLSQGASRQPAGLDSLAEHLRASHAVVCLQAQPQSFNICLQLNAGKSLQAGPLALHTQIHLERQAAWEQLATTLQVHLARSVCVTDAPAASAIEQNAKVVAKSHSLCGQVMVQPTGMVSLTGIATQGTFVRKLLDKCVSWTCPLVALGMCSSSHVASRPYMQGYICFGKLLAR
jgi:hypothetical protein